MSISPELEEVVEKISPKKSVINLTDYRDDNFAIHGYSISKILDDIILVQCIDVGDDSGYIRRGDILTMATARAWRLGKVILIGDKTREVKVGDIVSFPNDKGIPVDNINVKGIKGTIRNCVFLNEQRIFGICEELKDDKTD